LASKFRALRCSKVNTAAAHKPCVVDNLCLSFLPNAHRRAWVTCRFLAKLILWQRISVPPHRLQILQVDPRPFVSATARQCRHMILCSFEVVCFNTGPVRHRPESPTRYEYARSWKAVELLLQPLSVFVPSNILAIRKMLHSEVLGTGSIAFGRTCKLTFALIPFETFRVSRASRGLQPLHHQRCLSRPL
jgi:hypothetical protein